MTTPPPPPPKKKKIKQNKTLVQFRNDPPPPPPPKKKKKKIHKSSCSQKYYFSEILNQNNAQNLNIYENIGVPSPPPDSHCLGTPTTGRVSLCIISIQQTCVHLPSFLTSEKEFQTYLNVILQKTTTSKPLYNIS